MSWGIPGPAVDDGWALPPPTPISNDIEGLSRYLRTKTDEQILKKCFGLPTRDMHDIPPIGDNMLVICLDLEAWEKNHKRVTEVGIACFDSRDMPQTNDVDFYGESRLKQVVYYHARIQEHAHHINVKYAVGNPEANHFGHTRFLSIPMTVDFLKSIFQWPIVPQDASAGFCPVIILGHAIKGDKRDLKEKLGFDCDEMGTVVRTIDTQKLFRDVAPGPDKIHQIGLQRLVEEYCEFEYRDAHTATNDAAMTLICALQLIIDADWRPTGADGHLNDVVVRLASESQSNGAAGERNAWSHGTTSYCFRCGSNDHTEESLSGRCRARVYCQYCGKSKDPELQRKARTHITDRCGRRDNDEINAARNAKKSQQSVL